MNKNQRLLYKTSDREFIKTQDELDVISFISHNPISRSLVYDYLVEKWSVLIEK